MAKKKLKIGLALSGGSALGIAHLGVLQALEDHKIPIACLAGTSAGAIVAACYAFGVPIKKITEAAHQLKWTTFSKFSPSKMGLMDNSILGEMLAELIGQGPDIKIEDSPIPLAIVATDVGAGKRVVFTKGSLIKAVTASACLPGFFIPIEVDGRKLIDGGFVENLPIFALDELNPDFKLGVALRHYHSYCEPQNVLDIFSNVVGILQDKQSVLIEKAEGIYLINPHLEQYGSSDFKKADALIAEGYRATTLAIPEIKKLLADKKALSFWPSLLEQLGISLIKK